MKKNQYLKAFAAFGLAAVLFTSCGDVPQAEIDQATLAINEAKAAGAEVYATESYLALEDSMKSVIETVEAQKTKLFKNFTASKAGLASVAQLATMVKQETETTKEELKNQIQAEIAEVKSLIEANKQLITEAPKGKEGTTALLAIQGELSTIESTVSESGSLFEKGEYLASLDLTKAAKEKAAAINTELQDVIAKYKANTKAKRG